MKNLIFKYFVTLLFFYLSSNLFGQGPGGPEGPIGGTGGNLPVSISEKGINQLFVSPEVAQLLKVNFIPMNLYTGKLNLEIPLYEIKTGDISVPISVKYNSEGIKIEEEASNVGAGWVLQAGGNVSKIVRDMEDRSVYVRSSGSASSGYTSRAIALGSIAAFYYNGSLFNPSHDLMPDLFIATAPGLNSKFYLEAKLDNNGTTTKVKELGSSNNKINYGDPYGSIYDGDLKSLAWVGVDKAFPYITNQAVKNEIQANVDNVFQKYFNTFSDYSDFNITNTLGINYKFKTSDVNVVFPTSSSYDVYYSGIPDRMNLFWAIRNFFLEKYNINKGTWHIDEISDKANRKISFEYTSYTSQNVIKYPNKIIDSSVSLPNEGGDQSETNTILYNLSGTAGDTETNYDKSFYSMNALYNYISKIKWDGGEVNFIYNQNREDINNKKALSEILIKDSNLNIIKRYIFNYGYLSNGDAKRLKLQSIDIFEGIQQKRFYDFTYYEDTDLPLKDSFKKDFLGYYNNNVNVIDNQSYENYIPQLYFTRGRKNFSITPFNVNNSTPISGGVRNIEANNYSAVGLLKSIRNIAGAYNEFTYESNSFRFYNQDILGGGSRIQSQIIKELGGSERKIKYKYIDKNGDSSGSILNLPKFSEISSIKTINGNDIYAFRTSLRATSNIELTDGAYVGYERVIEEEIGKGSTEYIYTSPKQYPNTYASADFPPGLYNNKPLNKTVANSFFPGDVFIENDKTGKLINRKIFDNNSQLLEEKNIIYNDKIFDSRTYSIAKQLSRGVQSGKTYLYNVNFQLINSQNLLASEENISYLNGKQVKNKKEYTYGNSANPFLTYQKNTSSDNNIEESYFRYAADKGNQYLIDKNIINTPLEIETKENSKTISKKEERYPVSQSEADNKTTGFPLPYLVLSTDLQSTMRTEVSYDKYDSKGNIQQYTTKDGIPVSIVWGYNNTQPIAKIEGATYSQIESLASAIISASNTDALASVNNDETSFLSVLNSFRNNLSNYQVTTSTYDPLIGVRSITPPSGIREVYLYDNTNRLMEIRENNQTGRLLKEFKYNYKN
ncbi:hypothetical protein D1631_16980 [Chryseobacterium nematophagum]|uniref:RHS repeat protein n=1 Tax=Chryseobacterium nematophagum TaxID=2305228 RepID=A0A3M7TIX5_9FLAO|nr:hypothetical protein [Chryseobacterium nematophagum]RNA63491.1 hypothetical protein D1631_16980 [Chryseobacterium nematophagum]